MGKIIISTNMSLDGFVQDPDGKEGSASGNWFATYGGADLAEWARLGEEETRTAAALLLGRKTAEWFTPRWVGRPGDWAEAMNALPKYVVTRGDEAPWVNSTPVELDAVAALKASIAGDIVVYASYELARGLLELGLVDELRLFVFPVLLGSGIRLFSDAGPVKPLRLIRTHAVGTSLLFLNYEVFDQLDSK